MCDRIIARTHIHTQREVQMTKMRMRLKMHRENIVFIPDNINFGTVTRHDAQTIERTKERRFITTPYVWYRLSDLQKRTRAVLLFRKCKSSRDSGGSRCRAGINWEEWTGDGDDIQIRGAERKWQKYTYDTHPSYITRNWLVFRYRGIEFRFHPAPGQGAFCPRESKDPRSLYYPDIRYYVA